jgi:dTDP-4-amino-4,6-dideoxygalactose transaminase
VPALSNAVNVPLSNRVSFFVRDRESILDFFRRHRIDLVVWFDSPLSPVPSAPSFNYHPGHYPKAELAAAHVVNLPAHSRLTTSDVENICQLLTRYAEEHLDSQAAF